MILRGFTSLLNAGLFVVTLQACASAASAPVPEPQSRPTAPPMSPPPVVAPSAPAPAQRTNSRTTQWPFSYQAQRQQYTITVLGSVVQLPDSSAPRNLPETLCHIVFEVAPDHPPHLVSSPDIGNPGCADTASTFTFAQPFAVQFPTLLTVDMVWSDSATTNGVSREIPVQTTTVQQYRVIGDTTVAGDSWVIVQSTRIVHVSGEGARGEHRVLLNATGEGQYHLYLDPGRGRLVAANGSERTHIDIATSGRITKFLQTTKVLVTAN